MGKNFNGEILHFAVARLRVTGAGNLLLFLRSLDNIFSEQLPTIPLLSLDDTSPTVLANFNNQRGQLEIRTTEINEVFSCSKIILYVKPVATGYPQ